MQSQRITRREFLVRSGTAVAVPWFVPAGALGNGRAAAPSERLTLGIIGCGNRGLYDLDQFLVEPDVQCLAVCDCWESRRTKGKSQVDAHYGNKDCRIHRFHEELLARKDIDVVLIATGDRWHTVMSILACRAGKDVYCEKPFCLTIAEGRLLVKTTQRLGTIWQCGTQRRSNGSYRFVTETVRRGGIGKLHTITMSFGGWGARNGIPTPEPEPPGFDYDRWLGQAPWAPYSPVRVRNWRHNWDTGAGPIGDMGPHFVDTAQWGHDSEFSGAVEYEGEAKFSSGFCNVPYDVNVRARYADGVMIRMNSGTKGVRFDGDEGWIQVDDWGNITPKSMLRDMSVSGIGYTYMAGHVRNFLDCVRTRREPVSGPEISHRSHTIVHCANLCLRLGRRLRWNPETECFVNDDEANRMLRRTMRTPWGA